MLGRFRGMFGPHTTPSNNDWLLLPRGHRIDVAGVLRHQKAVARIAAIREEDGEPPALTATLFRAATAKEPNAVVVAVIVPGGTEALPIGNLTKDLAAAVSPVLRRLEDYGFRGIACAATLTEGGRRSRNHGVYGVALDVASRARVEEYVAAVRRNPGAQPAEFEEDPDSPEFKSLTGWRVPGWVE